MLFHTSKKKSSTPEIQIDSVQITKVNETKFLGLHLDENLNWTQHIIKLKNKISSGIFVLRYLARFCSLDVFLKVYNAHKTLILLLELSFMGQPIFKIWTVF